MIGSKQTIGMGVVNWVCLFLLFPFDGVGEHRAPGDFFVVVSLGLSFYE